MLGDYSEFHGYKIFKDSTVLAKNGKPLKWAPRKRNGGKYDKCVTLFINGKKKKFTLARLMCECFIGPMFGYEANHIDRDTMNCHLSNLERSTPSQNQLHWREDDNNKGEIENEKCA